MVSSTSVIGLQLMQQELTTGTEGQFNPNIYLSDAREACLRMHERQKPKTREME